MRAPIRAANVGSNGCKMERNCSWKFAVTLCVSIERKEGLTLSYVSNTAIVHSQKGNVLNVPFLLSASAQPFNKNAQALVSPESTLLFFLSSPLKRPALRQLCWRRINAQLLHLHLCSTLQYHRSPKHAGLRSRTPCLGCTRAQTRFLIPQALTLQNLCKSLNPSSQAQQVRSRK